MRRRMLELLHGRPLPAGAVADAFDEVSRPAVSRHLRVLREAGLVEVEVVGRERIYATDLEPLGAVEAWLHGFAAPWAQRLDALETEVHRTRRQRERGHHEPGRRAAGTTTEAETA
jgi:DNA-binding transcriptional ArsR family regulator